MKKYNVYIRITLINYRYAWHISNYIRQLNSSENNDIAEEKREIVAIFREIADIHKRADIRAVFNRFFLSNGNASRTEVAIVT
jgi:hypothetical protein